MEQEETKTTAAAGAEMPPEAESWVQLHESELTELMQKQAKAAITELKRQEKQERKKEKYHNTFTLMKCYRDAVFHIENAISDGQQLELNGMTDEQQRTYLESIRRTRFKTLIMTAHIDKAVEEIERRREAAGRGVEYKAFEMYFMQGMDYAEIAEELDTGKNTPRRWVTGIINELSVLLWGIDEERVK
jgi:transposase